MNSNSIVLATSLLLLNLTIAGCDPAEQTLADVNNTNIKKVRGAYGLYLVSHGLKGPADEQVFKEFLTTNAGAAAKLQKMGVSQDEVPQMFIGDRDGKPFKIRYGLMGLGDHPIVFEAEGIDGMRFVAFNVPREVDSKEYERLWKSKAKPNTGMEQMNQAAGTN